MLYHPPAETKVWFKSKGEVAENSDVIRKLVIEMGCWDSTLRRETVCSMSYEPANSREDKKGRKGIKYITVAFVAYGRRAAHHKLLYSLSIDLYNKSLVSSTATSTLYK